MKRSFAIAIAVLALGASAAQAGNKPPAGPTLEFSGALSHYVPATKTQNGSVTITIAGANLPGFTGTIMTFTINRSTKMIGHKIRDGDVGTVRVQYGDAAPFNLPLSVAASSVIDQS